VCAYDRPGTVHRDEELSRSDPVPQPITTQNAVDDLDALLKAADVPGPYVFAAHSCAGLIARVFASIPTRSRASCSSTPSALSSTRN
jgi:hypothetical protein